MTVAYVQLFIVALLLLTYFATQRLGGRSLFVTAVVAALLTVVTFVAVRTSGLLIVQLLVIWGTWFILHSLRGRTRRIADLEDLLDDALSDLPADVARHAAQAGKAGYRVIAGMEHRRILVEALQRASKELIVASGWVSTGVVDERFLASLSEALSRGVKVRLLFGWQAADASTSGGSHEKAVRRLRKFAEGAAQGKGRLLLHDLGSPSAAMFGNHAKVLVCDDAFVVCGSNNWLANRSFRNAELSILLEQPELVAEVRRAVGDILRNSRL